MRLKLTREQKIADAFLRAYDLVDDRLDSSLVGLERAESARTSITGSIEAMGLSGTQSDKMCESLAKIDKAVSDISELSGLFSDSFREIESFITDVQRIDGPAGKVLRLTYINRLSAKQVAENDEVCCSKKTVYELLKRGLDIAFDLLARE